MTEGPFDCIPPGKKPVRDEKTGEWTLVDLESENAEDLQKLYADACVVIKKQSEQIAELESQVKLLEGKTKPKGK